MKASSVYYPTPSAAVQSSSSAESVIFLPAAQIIPADTDKIPKSEQNQIIRLAASIKKYGILEPLSIKLSGNDVGFPIYELIDGERRFRAATIAGIERLPCTVLSPSAPKCLQHAYITRLKGENIHYFALAEAFYTLFQEYRMTQEEIARRMRLSQSAVANKLRLLRLRPEERALIQQAGLSERHARALLRLDSPAARREPLMLLANGAHTVAEAERLIDSYLPARHTKTPDFSENPAICEEKPPILPFSNATGVPASGAEAVIETAPTCAEVGQGITPSKFILRDLQPLYHSIERTLGIFKKTGATVEYRKQEDEHGALITISIPKKA